MITVHVDANELVTTGDMNGAGVMDSNENGFAYIADAMTAIALIVLHAEKKHGPLITNVILETLEGKKIRNEINKVREGARNVDQKGDCSGC